MLATDMILSSRRIAEKPALSVFVSLAARLGKISLRIKAVRG
jgi:hypothetical protein